jgi:hypothetical protein
MDTLRFRGRRLTDVFGDWVVPARAPFREPVRVAVPA